MLERCGARRCGACIRRRPELDAIFHLLLTVIMMQCTVLSLLSQLNVHSNVNTQLIPIAAVRELIIVSAAEEDTIGKILVLSSNLVSPVYRYPCLLPRLCNPFTNRSGSRNSHGCAQPRLVTRCWTLHFTNLRGGFFSNLKYSIRPHTSGFPLVSSPDPLVTRIVSHQCNEIHSVVRILHWHIQCPGAGGLELYLRISAYIRMIHLM